eukprot:scaffold10059_cov181-Skeletonema_marinoi.AAC.3
MHWAAAILVIGALQIVQLPADDDDGSTLCRMDVLISSDFNRPEDAVAAAFSTEDDAATPVAVDGVLLGSMMMHLIRGIGSTSRRLTSSGKLGAKCLRAKQR